MLNTAWCACNSGILKSALPEPVHFCFSVVVKIRLKYLESRLRIAEVILYLESWVPPTSALAGDPTGLQVGDPSANLKNILVALEVTDRVIEEAIENEANLILSHHPLVHQPLQRLDASTYLGRKIERLIKNGITVYCAHTNLDASREGVSVVLAKALGVAKPNFLIGPDRSWLRKLVVFVPKAHVDMLREALAQAGAGNIGNYSHCSFNLTGTGTFWGTEAASPAVGEKGRLERVEEVRLEMILPIWRTEAVVAALRAAHPYEEIAYDVYPLENADTNYGFGAIGSLEHPVSLAELITRIREKLGVKTVGVVEGPAERISRVAVCGGSGGDLIEAAWKQGAQAFVTGEMKYRKYLEFEDRITLLTVGHYASEAVILPVWVKHLEDWLGKESVSVIETKMLTNPLKYIN